MQFVQNHFCVADELMVYFFAVPPATLTITTDPSDPVAGSPLTLTCKSASSNPASDLTWWKDGQQIQVLSVVGHAK